MTGKNKVIRTKDVETTAPEISFIVEIAASLDDMPASIFLETDSTTKIPSSTTKPVARTSPVRVRKLSVKPNNFKKKKVPTIATGIAKAGINTVRHFFKNNIRVTNTKITANPRASVTFSIESKMKVFWSVSCITLIPGGAVFLNSAIFVNFPSAH